MAKVISIEWSYSPSDFFREPVEESGDNYVARLENGSVVATLLDSQIENPETARQKIEADLTIIFLGAQLQSDRKYCLTGGTIVTTSPGSRSVAVPASGTRLVATVGDVDTSTSDSSGKVTFDSGVEKEKKKVESSRRAFKLRGDPKLVQLLLSHNAAINAPHDEFKRLYEIRDALSEIFGGKKNACKVLGISETTWSQFGNITNDPKLSQGRHGGKNSEQRRNATDDELKAVRAIAKAMIEAYEDHIDPK